MPKSVLSSVLLTAAVFVAAIVFNPAPDKHREQIRQATAERHPVAGALGLGALTAFVSSYHSWGVASYTTANERVLSIGAFGVVVVLDQQPKG
jgi:hypothetical protein